MAESPIEQEASKRVVERSPVTKEEVEKRLHLYHGISDSYGDLLKQIRRVGILSPREIEKRGVQRYGTNTLAKDRDIANDFYVFLSPLRYGYGGVAYQGYYLEIDKSILNSPGTIVNTAGDYVSFTEETGEVPEDKVDILTDYYFKSRIPGAEFADYLVDFINKLPDPNWFFDPRSRKGKQFERFRAEAETEIEVPHHQGATYEKFKMLQALDPEIMVLGEVPIGYIKRVSRAPALKRVYSEEDSY